MLILGRLAVDVSLQGNGGDRVLMQEEARRVPCAATAIGVRGMLVPAASDSGSTVFSAARVWAFAA